VVTQSWNARQYAQHARFVSDLGLPVVELLAPHSGERILDLGCGDGVLSKHLADLGCDVVAVDASADMVQAARRLGVDARVVDARALAFDREFDAVFTNAALHWMGPPEPILRGIARALKPGGRVAGECGGHGNVEIILGALKAALRERGLDSDRVNPWYFATVEEYDALFEQFGLVRDSIVLFPRPTPLPGTLNDWLETFAQSFLNTVPAADRAALLDDVSARCAPVLRDADGKWTADYVRLRFAASRP
jgi:SAM-dependent methyltransferase